MQFQEWKQQQDRKVQEKRKVDKASSSLRCWIAFYNKLFPGSIGWHNITMSDVKLFARRWHAQQVLSQDSRR